MIRNTTLRASVSLAGMAFGMALSLPGGAAHAQTAPEAADRGITEIIVTANRREEGIQKVATSVTAISSDTLREQNISTVADLLGRVPSLNVTSNGQQRDSDTITIRGQGQTYLAPTGVVNYFSEVPLIAGSIISTQGGPGTIFDLQSLQVLRGPQGTLFGKNTTGGALLLGPKKPTDTFEGYVAGQIGNYGDREFEGAINLPVIADVLAIRIAAKKVDRNGYTKDVGTSDLPLSLPFQGAGGTTLILQNSGKVLPGNGPNLTAAGASSALPTTASLGNDYTGKDYDDRHYWTVRAGILLKPAEGIENYLVGYYTKSHNNGTGQVMNGVAGDHPTVFNLIANAYGNPGNLTPGAVAFNSADPRIAQALAARQALLGPRKVSLSSDQFFRMKTWSIVDTLSVDITDQLTFRNIAGYQRLEQEYNWDLDGSALPVLSQVPAVVTAAWAARFPSLTVGERAKITDSSLFTEEPQLLGTFLDGKLTFVTGAFYSKQKPEGLQATGSYNGAAYGGGFFAITTKSKAGYAQGSLDLGAFTPGLDGLKVTGGIRRTTDEYNGTRISPAYVVLPVASAGDKITRTTWTVGLDYQMDNALVFGKVTHGYKAGGFNYAGPSVRALTFNPEYVTSYEIGVKSDFRVGSVPVRLNVSGYQLNYRDIQRAAGENTPNGCPNAANPLCNTTGLDQGAITYNAGRARVRGLETEIVARLFPGFELSGSHSYTKGKYREYLLAVSPDPATGAGNGIKQTCTGPVSIPRGVGAPITFLDLSCAPFPFSPKHQFSINARYEADLGDARMVVSANYTHADKNWTAVTILPEAGRGGYVDAYDLVNASVEFNGIYGSGLDARLFVTNLFDKTFQVSNTASSLDGSTGYSTAIYNEPRMYGLQLRYRFGGQ